MSTTPQVPSNSPNTLRTAWSWISGTSIVVAKVRLFILEAEIRYRYAGSRKVGEEAAGRARRSENMLDRFEVLLFAERVEQSIIASDSRVQQRW
jgi:hypothetical protein